MTDKERILMNIVTRIIPGIAYGLRSKRDDYIEPCMMYPEKLKHGDLVFANTTIYLNDFVVGFVNDVKDDCVVIREIGSKRLCNYYNESFTRINKKYLGYEILEGIQYKIYQKVLKAFEKYTRYYTRFKSIIFDKNICTVQSREAFKDDLFFEVSFSFNDKTTIKEIGRILANAEKERFEI